MIEIKTLQKLEDYQLRQLEEERLFINKYDLSLKYNYELGIYWKEFFFDLISELIKKDGCIFQQNKNSLFDYFKKEYYNIIKEYKLNIDIQDYIEISDYISLKEWESLAGNFLTKVDKDYYLIKLK